MKGLKATSMMIVAELIMSGFSVFYKLASNDGMRMSILIAYRYLFASIFILPLALFVERNKRPKLTWTILFHAFLCAVFGGPMAQNLYAESIILTSATFSTAFSNLIPPFTFIIAVLFRLEKVEIGRIAGKTKVIGTLVGVGGAMLLTFYRGPQLNTWSTHLNVLHKSQRMDGHVADTHNTSSQHMIGSVLSLTASLSIALNFILQSKMNVDYPCFYSSSFLISVIGFIQSFVYALCTERSWTQWKLGWNIRLISVGFMGVASAPIVILIMASIHLQGPLFVSNFNPLMLVFVTIAGFLILDEKLHLGSVLGSVIIIVGLYAVLWGKGKEEKRATKLISAECSKDLNDVSNTKATNTTLETVSMARTSFSVVDEGDELSLKSSKETHKDQENSEEV